MNRPRPSLPVLAATAAVTALAGLAAVPSLRADVPAASLTAQSAVAPTPVALPSGPSSAQEKALRRDATADASASASARALAAREKAARDARARASRSRRAAAVSGDPRTIARAMLAERGQAGQFGCLDRLWTKESEWRVRATNPSSGAYGIPQSLPASKMASAGSDWRTNPRTQIRWGLGYIAERYGSPCAAWSHSQANGWY